MGASPKQLFHIVLTVYTTRCAVLGGLPPSDIASLACSIPLSLSDGEKKRYYMLHRELPAYTSWIEDELSTGEYYGMVVERLLVDNIGHTVAMVGKDLYTLVESIKNPLFYWSAHTHKASIVIWLVVIEGFMSQHQSERTCTHKNMHRTYVESQHCSLDSQYERDGTLFVLPNHTVNELPESLHGWVARYADDARNVVVMFYARSVEPYLNEIEQRTAHTKDALINYSDKEIHVRQALTCHRRIKTATEVVIGSVCPYVALNKDCHVVVSLPHRELDHDHVYLNCGKGSREPFNVIAIL